MCWGLGPSSFQSRFKTRIGQFVVFSVFCIFWNNKKSVYVYFSTKKYQLLFFIYFFQTFLGNIVKAIYGRIIGRIWEKLSDPLQPLRCVKVSPQKKSQKSHSSIGSELRAVSAALINQVFFSLFKRFYWLICSFSVFCTFSYTELQFLGILAQKKSINFIFFTYFFQTFFRNILNPIYGRIIGRISKKLSDPLQPPRCTKTSPQKKSQKSHSSIGSELRAVSAALINQVFFSLFERFYWLNCSFSVFCTFSYTELQFLDILAQKKVSTLFFSYIFFRHFLEIY